VGGQVAVSWNVAEPQTEVHSISVLGLLYAAPQSSSPMIVRVSLHVAFEVDGAVSFPAKTTE